MPEDFRQKQEEATRSRANMLKLPYIDSRSLHQTPLVLDVLTNAEMYHFRMVPLAKETGRITFAMTIGTPQPSLQSIKERFPDFNVEFVMISDIGYKELMLRYDPPKEVTYEDIDIKKAGDDSNLQEISAKFETVNSDDILEYLINQAYALNASDIHLETAKNYVRMRMRIDGTLHPVAKLSFEKYKQLQQSIAVKANISSTAPDAQTSHLTQEVPAGGGYKTLNMRIETVPTNYGQDAVIRLLNMTAELLSVKKLGLSETDQATINDVIEHPHGMVLVVGPTGSGKTTTLYSILQGLNSPNRKIITLEDPVEYGFDGISQLPVRSRAGESFADRLRAVLRLDPDVVMVGEIRDVDTAKTALQAALTGHLVLSTFHAGDAPAAVTRMMDIIGENPLFVSSVRLIIAQRLVRNLDPATKIAYEPEPKVKEILQKIVDDLPKGIEKPNLDGLKLYKPGKSADNPFGYKGRQIIIEQLKMTPDMQTLIRQGGRVATTDLIREVAQKDGMLTMLQDGILKAIKGTTTLEEIYRVVDVS